MFCTKPTEAVPYRVSRGYLSHDSSICTNERRRAVRAVGGCGVTFAPSQALNAGYRFESLTHVFFQYELLPAAGCVIITRHTGTRQMGRSLD